MQHKLIKASNDSQNKTFIVWQFNRLFSYAMFVLEQWESPSSNLS